MNELIVRDSVEVTTVEDPLPPAPALMPQNTYNGASHLDASKEEIEILCRPIDPATVSIRPDGIVYLSWTHINRILREAFGLSYSLVPDGEPQINGREITWYHHLYVRGCYVRSAYGTCNYSPNNRTMSYSDAVEGAHSDALRRCSKGLGIASELWDSTWINEFKARHCEVDGRGKWRRKRMAATLPRPPAPAPAPAPKGKPSNGKFALQRIRDDEKNGGAWLTGIKAWGGGDDTLSDCTYMDALGNTTARSIMRRMVAGDYLPADSSIKQRIETVLAARDKDKAAIREKKAELKALMVNAGVKKRKHQDLAIQSASDGKYTNFPSLDKATVPELKRITERFNNSGAPFPAVDFVADNPPSGTAADIQDRMIMDNLPEDEDECE